MNHPENITVYHCQNMQEYRSMLQALRRACLLTPQAVYFESDSTTPEITGTMLQNCIEIPLFTGGSLRAEKDILCYSIAFYSELYEPFEFAT